MLHLCEYKELAAWEKVYNTTSYRYMYVHVHVHYMCRYLASSFRSRTFQKFSDTLEQEFISMNINKILLHSMVLFNYERQQTLSENFRKVQKPKELVE